MDTSFRTPLVDCFRRGEVTRDVRLEAAAGTLAPRAHEQVALLMLLTEDGDAEIAATAEATIRRMPVGPLAAYLSRSDVSQDVRDFFGKRGVAAALPAAESADQPLVETDQGPEGAETPGESGPKDAEAEAERKGTAQRLATLSVAERIKVAMQGTREERSVLIRDPNRLVSASVLSSPKLTESEVEAIARMTNVSDEVLRIVGQSRAWTKNYNVIANLARNAKTPIAISLGLMNRLIERDIRMLASDRNIPEPIRVAARKIFVQNQTRRQ
jgi:hypothetical protein